MPSWYGLGPVSAEHRAVGGRRGTVLSAVTADIRPPARQARLQWPTAEPSGAVFLTSIADNRCVHAWSRLDSFAAYVGLNVPWQLIVTMRHCSRARGLRLDTRS
jgi:hypothetical protein